jgi:hypothetical protein
LYTVRQIGIASFLGGPAAGAWFISRNYVALSQPEKVRRVLVLGGVVTAALVPLALLLPESTPHSLLPLAYTAAFYYYAEHLFGSAIKLHLAAGGARGSWWTVVGVALLIVLVLVGLLFGLVMAALVVFPGAFQ